jgi:omega-6 fatty acid desaturase (delta-12 desaturase)
MFWFFGWQEFLMVQLPITFIASSTGTWLFYIQHQFEDTYWTINNSWDYTLAALQGSSYYKLPKILQWFTGNIGFHHIHHLSPKIPNYQLEKCHKENPVFQVSPELTLRSSLRSLFLRLWDERQKKLISFHHFKKLHLQSAENLTEQ